MLKVAVDEKKHKRAALAMEDDYDASYLDDPHTSGDMSDDDS